MTATNDLSGVDVEAFTSWLSLRVDLDGPLVFKRVHGGRSNLTFVVTDAAGNRWVLRRPPLVGVNPSAHDMRREHTVMAALEGTQVPVPKVVGYEPTNKVIGSEFYVMEYVHGDVIRSEEDARATLGETQRRVAGESLVDVLVELHSLQPDAVGLADFAKKEDYVARQLHRWNRQLDELREGPGARRLGVLRELHRRLVSDVPEQGSATIVHGDYRLDNAIIGGDGRLRAVLDWELSTLGDPLADVGLLAVYWAEPGDDFVALESSPSLVEGFPNRADLIDRYSRRSGRDVSQLSYYVGLAMWKLAIIMVGVSARFASGAYGQTVDDSWMSFDVKAEQLGERALQAVRASGR